MNTNVPQSAREPPREDRGHGLRAAGIQAAGASTPRAPRKGPINPLLVKDDVGRARQSCYDLPNHGFAFGRPGNTDVEGAREVSMRWVSHNASKGPQETFPDFMKLNKKAACSNVATAKDLKHFKQVSEVGVRTPRYAALGNTKRDAVPSDVVQGFTYGRKVRPSTPINEVISYRFAEKAEQEIGQFYEDFYDSREVTGKQVRKITHTSASRGHAMGGRRMQCREEQKELFKMSKFKHIKPKVSNQHGVDLIGGRKKEILGAYLPSSDDFGDGAERLAIEEDLLGDATAMDQAATTI